MAAAISEILLKQSRGGGHYGLALVSRPSSVSYSTSPSSSGTERDKPPKRPIAEPNPHTTFKPSLAALKRGTGGRSSFNGMVATVFGATGLIGQAVCNRLGKAGTQVIIPYRGSDYDVRPLKLVGDLGQVLFQPYYIRDEESIRKAVKYSNVVINLVGRDWETRNFTFKDVNVTAAKTIARISREEGVKRLIHFSSLNASPNPTPLMMPDGSKFLKTKYEGELAVRDEFPDATIFRPSDVYGQADRFLRYYVHFWRRNFFDMPMWEKGEKTIKQPVFLSDVATGVINALKDPETAGKTYDAIGPKRYQLSELVDYIFRVVRRTPDLGYRRTNMMWSPTFLLRVHLIDKYSWTWPVGYLGWDKLERDHTTDVPTGNPTLEDLGVVLSELENRIHWELKPFRRDLYYEEELGEFPSPAPPKTIAV